MKKIFLALFLVFPLLCFGQGTLLTSSESITYDTLGVASANTASFTGEGFSHYYIEYSATLTGVYKTIKVDYDCKDVATFRFVSASDSTVTLEGKIGQGTTWVQLPMLNYSTSPTRTFAITAAQMVRIRGYK